MKWTEEEIAAAISKGTLNVLSLDTSVFDGERNRFEHGLLVRLRQFKTTDVSVVLADVPGSVSTNALHANTSCLVDL